MGVGGREKSWGAYPAPSSFPLLAPELVTDWLLVTASRASRRVFTRETSCASVHVVFFAGKCAWHGSSRRGRIRRSRPMRIKTMKLSIRSITTQKRKLNLVNLYVLKGKEPTVKSNFVTIVNYLHLHKCNQFRNGNFIALGNIGTYLWLKFFNGIVLKIVCDIVFLMISLRSIFIHEQITFINIIK